MVNIFLAAEHRCIAAAIIVHFALTLFRFLQHNIFSTEEISDSKMMAQLQLR